MIKDIYAEYEIYERVHGETDEPTFVTLDTLQGRGLNARFIESSVGSTTDNSVMLSSIPKMLISIDPAFYHSILDQISAIIFFQKRYSGNIVFVLFANEEVAIDSFIIELIKSNGYKYVILDNENGSSIKVKNFFYTKVFRPTEVGIKTACLAYKTVLNDPDKEPTKKVYLSRRKIEDKTQNRIDDEGSLEDYLVSRGFQIVYPEDFKSIADQINFMNGVKVLASIAGSGLMNQLFMQDYQSVLSLDSGMATQFGKLSEIKYAYLVKVEFNKVATTLIETLERDTEAQKLINS